MHTGHIILIKADDHEDAISRVWSAINADENWFANAWADWAAITDGRFDLSHFFGGEYNGVHNHAVSYETEKDLFLQLIESRKAERRAEFDRLLAEIKEDGRLNLDNYELDEDSMASWKLYRFSSFVNSSYNPYSKIYDLENYDTNLKNFTLEIESETGEKNWYGVLVDFHY